MRFLVTGATGQLGYDIVEELKKREEIYLAPSSIEMDITNKSLVENIFESFKPNIVFHCAAYTAVDKAEDEKEKCYNINVVGTENIVEASKKIGAKVIYISTDYVFDGTKEGKYNPEDKTNPINYYGYTKLCGEKIVNTMSDSLIARISWVFGINGKNFIRTMLKLSETKDSLSVVSDQIGSPTYTEDLAKLLLEMVYKNKTGLFHITNEGYCSWYEFAKYIFEINGIDITVNPILTKDYPTKAKRPLNSKLNKDKLEEEGLQKMPNWQDATRRYCKKIRR